MQKILYTRSAMGSFLLCCAFSVIIAICAHIKIPCYPVPFTLQTMGVFAVAAHLGAKLGALTVLIYIAEGLIGLPVFTTSTAILGPTGGYIIGFIPAAYVIGFAKDRFSGLAATVSSVVLAELVLFFFGWLQLAQFIGYSAAYNAGVVPFYLSEAVKIVASVALISRIRKW